MIVVLDTNVWISGLIFGGSPDLAIQRALTVDRVAVSAYIHDEIVRVLTSKFSKDRTALEEVLAEMLSYALVVEVTGEITGVCRDPKDDAILETAWRARADLLVAGDKDLLSMGSFRGIQIVTPAQYVAIKHNGNRSETQQ